MVSITKTTVYTTSDGSHFTSRSEAEAHESKGAFEKLTGLSATTFEALPRTGEAWAHSPESVLELAAMFIDFAAILRRAKREAEGAVRFNSRPAHAKGQRKRKRVALDGAAAAVEAGGGLFDR